MYGYGPEYGCGYGGTGWLWIVLVIFIIFFIFCNNGSNRLGNRWC